VHPHVGFLELNCQTLLDPDQGHHLLVYTAAPGSATSSRTVAGQQGYTGTDDRDEMLRNSHFVDAKAELFVKSGSSNWTRVGEYPVARQLLPPESH